MNKPKCFYNYLYLCLLLHLSLFQIVHLKRFQFNNGRWIKSQKVVNFPIDGLDPLTYTEGDAEPHPLEDPTEERPMSQTPPIGVDNEIEPLEVPIEVHQEEEEGGSSDHKKEESEEETKEQNSEEDRPEDREEGKETEEGKENSLEHQDTEDKAREADEVGVVDHTPEEEAVDGVREELDSEGGGDNSALTRPIYDLFAVTVRDCLSVCLFVCSVYHASVLSVCTYVFCLFSAMRVCWVEDTTPLLQRTPTPSGITTMIVLVRSVGQSVVDLLITCCFFLCIFVYGDAVIFQVFVNFSCIN